MATRFGEANSVGRYGLPQANGALLAQLESRCDVFVTADKNLRYQQNLAGRTLAIVELPTNRLPLLLPMFGRLATVVESATPGAYIVVPDAKGDIGGDTANA